MLNIKELRKHLVLQGKKLGFTTDGRKGSIKTDEDVIISITKVIKKFDVAEVKYSYPNGTTGWDHIDSLEEVTRLAF